MKFMARLASLSIATTLLAAGSFAQQISVEASKSVPLRIKGAASSVVLGNKNIADVSIHSENLMFITGKAYGTTNLLVFDKDGRQLFSSDVVVTANSANLVTVNKSGSSYTFDCAPECRPVMSTGDNAEYFDGLAKQHQATQALTEGE